MTEINTEINSDILCSNSREMATPATTCISAMKKPTSNDQLMISK